MYGSPLPHGFSLKILLETEFHGSMVGMWSCRRPKNLGRPLLGGSIDKQSHRTKQAMHAVSCFCTTTTNASTYASAHWNESARILIGSSMEQVARRRR